jgi:hypothetical protein
MGLVFIIKFSYNMNLNCFNNIITDNLAIYIDLTNLNSWNLNTGLTLFSLTKWKNATVDDLNLIDFGLTAFDNGRINKLYSGLTLTQNNDKLVLYRIGFNNDSGGTFYTGYAISGVTGSSVGRYFSLSGGYLQGFFKLEDYNFNLLPFRYNKGITIETIIEILPQSEGIFYYMGTRAEDKYNPFFSGETTITNTTNISYEGKSTGNTYQFTGVTTSENNYLVAYSKNNKKLSNFKQPEYADTIIFDSVQQLNNISNNIISFEITDGKKIKYKYVNSNGNIIQNESPNIINRIGWTIIGIVFKPYEIIDDFDSSSKCYPRRKGNLIFYINGREFWKIKDFNEFYFKGLNNDKEKQLGVPYNISWGGGSFGLKNSWHYDYQTHFMYTGQSTTYINNNFTVEADPISSDCYIAPTGDTYLAGLSLSADSTTFTYADKCNPNIKYPLTVMRIQYTGGTGNTYFIKFNQPISALSNRDYIVNLLLFNNNFFSGGSINKISTIMYSDDVDINIINSIEYVYPLTNEYILSLQNLGLHPFADRCEYEYVLDKIMYYGVNGIPVSMENALTVGFGNESPNIILTGENSWLPIKTTFKTEDNSGKNIIYIGILIETDGLFNTGGTLYINDFKCIAADNISQDKNKNNLLIEKYFNSSYIGNIQKLRVYDIALQPQEILHNAIVEAKNNTGFGILISKGGRIIQQYEDVPYTPQQSSGSDIRKSIRYRNSDGSYKDLYQMIDIKVIIKSRNNPSVELIKFKKITTSGWTQLIFINDTTYDFIVPNTITAQHPNEILFAEIKFQWADPDDIDNVFDKIFVIDITNSNLLDNTVKNY